MGASPQKMCVSSSTRRLRGGAYLRHRSPFLFIDEFVCDDELALAVIRPAEHLRTARAAAARPSFLLAEFGAQLFGCHLRVNEPAAAHLAGYLVSIEAFEALPEATEVDWAWCHIKPGAGRAGMRDFLAWIEEPGGRVIARTSGALVIRPPGKNSNAKRGARQSPGQRATEVPESIVLHRTFAADEPYFAGHFPNDPIVPGVLIADLMAEAAALLAPASSFPAKPSAVRAQGIVFQQMIRPGTAVAVEARHIEQGKVSTASVAVFADGHRCARGRFTLSAEP